MKTLITHNGPFHTDDIFACATIELFLESQNEKFEVVRTRDEGVIAGADFVFDVGGVYDAEKNRFDHHQSGGAGKRSFGAGAKSVEIEYASFGLVWKKFGLALAGTEDVAAFVDKDLAAPIDANDNGFGLIEKKYEVSPFLIQDMFSLMRPTWTESPENHDANFLKAVDTAKEIISRSIVHGRDALLAEQLVMDAYNNAADKRIIVLDNYYPLSNALDVLPEALFVLYPRESDGFWTVKTIRESKDSFKNRKDLPKAWSGLINEELQKVSGVSDAVFCHRALFTAAARSKEGAVKMAQIAVESSI